MIGILTIVIIVLLVINYYNNKFSSIFELFTNPNDQTIFTNNQNQFLICLDNGTNIIHKIWLKYHQRFLICYNNLKHIFYLGFRLDIIWQPFINN
jgi:hypothetical protein